jgi:hypothetical protein
MKCIGDNEITAQMMGAVKVSTPGLYANQKKKK